MTGKLSKIQELAWIRLVRASQGVIASIEAGLRAEGFPPLAWYDVLLELERSRSGLRPSEIANQTLFERYSVTRLVDRLETQGLVLRVACPEDRRGAVVRITDAGRTLRRRMWPAYANAIRRRMAQKLSEKEAKTLAALLGKLQA